MHVVLQVDAPVDQGAEDYEADGLVSGDRIVHHVAKCGAGLTRQDTDGEDTDRTDWFRFPSDSVEDDGGEVVLLA